MKRHIKTKSQKINFWLPILGLTVVGGSLTGVSMNAHNSSFKRSSKTNSRQQQQQKQDFSDTNSSSNFETTPIVFNSPVYDVSSTVIDTTWTAKLGSWTYTTTVGATDPWGEYKGTATSMLSFTLKRSTIALGFDIRNTADLKDYISENGGYVPFTDLYNYRNGDYGKGALVSNLSLAMKNGFHVGTVSVDYWTHYDTGYLDNGNQFPPGYYPPTIPGKDEHYDAQTLNLFGQNIDLNQSEVTWTSTDGKFALRYKTDSDIMENIYVSYDKHAKCFALSFAQKMQFNISIMTNGQWYNNLFDGSDYQDGQPSGTKQDRGIDRGINNSSDYTPIAASYSICDIELASGYPATPRGGVATFKQGDFIMYDINGNVFNTSSIQDWCTFWRTNLTIKAVGAVGYGRQRWSDGTGRHEDDNNYTQTMPFDDVQITEGTYDNPHPDKNDPNTNTIRLFNASIPYWTTYTDNKTFDPAMGPQEWQTWIDSVKYEFSIVDTKTNAALFNFALTSKGTYTEDISSAIKVTDLGNYDKDGKFNANWATDKINELNNTNFSYTDLKFDNINTPMDGSWTAKVSYNGERYTGSINITIKGPIMTDIASVIKVTDIGYVNSIQSDAIISAINNQNKTQLTANDVQITDELSKDGKSYTATVTGIGTYYGAVTITFTYRDANDIATLVTNTRLGTFDHTLSNDEVLGRINKLNYDANGNSYNFTWYHDKDSGPMSVYTTDTCIANESTQILPNGSVTIYTYVSTLHGANDLHGTIGITWTVRITSYF